MKYGSLVVTLLLYACCARGADVAAPDEETQQFSDYIYKVANMNGQFHGVYDYCSKYSPKDILDRTQASWNKTNGAYIDSIDAAIAKYVGRRIEQSRQTSVTEALKSNVKTWFAQAHENSKLLVKLNESDTKEVTCSYYLGVMVSASFDFKKMMPDVYEYWEKNLRP